MIHTKTSLRSPNLPLHGPLIYLLSSPLPARKSSFLYISMKIKTSRLPRRYDDVMKTLRGLLASKAERIRFQAAMRMSEILLEHQRAEERVTIATERAAARKTESEAAEQPDAQPVQQNAEEAARAFLARIKGENSAATAD